MSTNLDIENHKVFFYYLFMAIYYKEISKEELKKLKTNYNKKNILLTTSTFSKIIISWTFFLLLFYYFTLTYNSAEDLSSLITFLCTLLSLISGFLWLMVSSLNLALNLEKKLLKYKPVKVSFNQNDLIFFSGEKHPVKPTLLTHYSPKVLIKEITKKSYLTEIEGVNFSIPFSLQDQYSKLEYTGINNKPTESTTDQKSFINQKILSN